MNSGCVNRTRLQSVNRTINFCARPFIWLQCNRLVSPPPEVIDERVKIVCAAKKSPSKSNGATAANEIAWSTRAQRLSRVQNIFYCLSTWLRADRIVGNFRPIFPQSSGIGIIITAQKFHIRQFCSNFTNYTKSLAFAVHIGIHEVFSIAGAHRAQIDHFSVRHNRTVDCWFKPDNGVIAVNALSHFEPCVADWWTRFDLYFTPVSTHISRFKKFLDDDPNRACRTLSTSSTHFFSKHQIMICCQQSEDAIYRTAHVCSYNLDAKML